MAQPARANTFPTRPITLVSAGATGGPTDTIARIIADSMGTHLGQTIVVEAIGGSTVAPLRVAQARPDGYTLLINNIGFAASPTMYRRLPYDVLRSFAPLGLVSDAAMTVITRPDFPGTTFQDVLKTISREGDRINFGAAGLGSSSNLCALLVQQAAQGKATVVNFRGTAPAMTELMAGRLDVLCDQATGAAPYVLDGRVRGWAVSSQERLGALPNLPTTKEAGAPTIAMTTWHGMYAPANTPEDVQERISEALRAALREPVVQQRFAELVTSPAKQENATPSSHRRFLAAEVERWRPVITAAGTYVD
ncbi:tripartite tricarboxylate transporter substrate-binding protein [Roseomonas xinghualingensis]|uniref:tripartite tricarboxylate transporter substrate-binding protein n=1 Tax=Roseomonas xinghualingensis TaxID=2986475 RepID=UPI0021F24559|nr:tripartite tricarboxylate transporter substrate-binding protein [Roseomonas sp. SXEYE001]MCV4210269.1 tripartite tricarboxylate transporter substrate-binding protein [Roseomonas sp. SXEYE001]